MEDVSCRRLSTGSRRAFNPVFVLPYLTRSLLWPCIHKIIPVRGILTHPEKHLLWAGRWMMWIQHTVITSFHSLSVSSSLCVLEGCSSARTGNFLVPGLCVWASCFLLIPQCLWIAAGKGRICFLPVSPRFAWTDGIPLSEYWHSAEILNQQWFCQCTLTLERFFGHAHDPEPVQSCRVYFWSGQNSWELNCPWTHLSWLALGAWFAVLF